MSVSYLPTEHNVMAAWEEYQALMMAADKDHRLLCDLEHCQNMARAWARWRDLYMATERAA